MGSSEMASQPSLWGSSFLSLKETLRLGQEGRVGVLAHGGSVGFGVSVGCGMCGHVWWVGGRLAPRHFENSGTGPFRE